jgi:hypothetical protein
MGKAAPNATIDAELDYIAGSDTLYVCSGEPADFSGIAAVTLASASLVGGDFTKADATGGGRKVTVSAIADVSVATSGTATHIVVANASDSTLRYVTTCTSQAITSGNFVNVPSWSITVGDPT